MVLAVKGSDRAELPNVSSSAWNRSAAVRSRSVMASSMASPVVSMPASVARCRASTPNASHSAVAQRRHERRVIEPCGQCREARVVGAKGKGGSHGGISWVMSGGASYLAQGTAAIAGQAFLVTRGGDSKKAAGNSIVLDPMTPFTTEVVSPRQRKDTPVERGASRQFVHQGSASDHGRRRRSIQVCKLASRPIHGPHNHYVGSARRLWSVHLHEQGGRHRF
jgi:hypothetical protein